MNLVQVLDPDLIMLDLKAATKEKAVDILVDLFCRKFPDRNKDDIIAAIREREKASSTNMGRGVAFPHARTQAVTDIHVVLGLSAEGIKDDTPDNKPIQLVVLLLTPPEASQSYLPILSQLAAFVRNPRTLPSLLMARCPQDVIDIVKGSNVVDQPGNP